MRLFARRGAEAVTVRDIAAAASVSPALILRHYGSKDGLCEAVDDHVAGVFESMLANVTGSGDGEALDAEAVPSLAEVVAGTFGVDSPIPAYLGRLLIGDGRPGAELFRKLYSVSLEAAIALERNGAMARGTDREVRAAFLLVNDLAVLMLRSRLQEVLGVDPLSAAGMQRWGAEVLTVYRSGLGASHDQ
ncbi:hypothetical protein GCM10027344_27580 [Spelaeicoccus albus]